MIKSRTFYRSLFLVASIAVVAPSITALAQPAPTAAAQQEASTRFRKGFDLFKDGDYQAALIEFRRAYELAPNYNVLYNIGQVSFQLQDYPTALHALEQYLNEGGRNIDSKRRAEVEKDIDKLRARVANLEIVVNTPDADISIDDVAVGKSPLAKPVMVSAGRHKININKTGFTAASKSIEIASAESQKITLDLIENKVAVEPPVPTSSTAAPTATVQVPPPVPTDQTPPPPPPRSIPWAGWVVTGGLGVGAVVTGVLALGASGDLKTERASATATRDTLDSAKSKTQTFALVTDILLGSAVVAGGVTLYFTVAGGSSDSKPKPAGAPAGAFSKPVVRVGVTPGGLSLAGTF